LKILALDTATENCSAALWIDGSLIQKEVEVERGHANLILTMVDELLVNAGVTLTALTAIAFGRGPGSFTGVRLAASVTQGLAFGANLPVVPISDLQAVAQRTLTRPPNGSSAPRHVLVCNDARMSEVYWGCFQQSSDAGALALMTPVGPERVSKPTDVVLPDAWRETLVYGAGRGFAAYAQTLCNKLSTDLSNIYNTLLPAAAEIALLAVPEVAVGRTVAAEEAIPVYLRDDVAKPAPSLPPAT
jgi:tRNA threonylcarbamoyladenosine biosynthesis protein TsaB